MATQSPQVRVRLSAEGVQEVVAALQQVQQGAKKAGDQVASAGAGMQAATAGVANFTKGLKLLAAAAAGLVVLDKIRDFGTLGLNDNRELESASIGLAAVIASQADLVDSQGRVLAGQEAFNAAVNQADQFLAGLQSRIVGTSLDFGELANVSKGIVFSGLNAGVTDLTQLQEITVSVATALNVLGEDIGGVGKEVEALLQGKAKGSSLAKQLQIDSDTLASWKQQGILVEEVNKRLAGFAIANGAAAESFDGLATRANIALEDIAAASTGGLFDRLKTGFSGVLKSIYDSAGNLSPALLPTLDLLDRIGSAVGTVIVDAFQGTVDLAKRFGTFLEQNEGSVGRIAAGAKAAYEQFKLAAGASADILAPLLKSGIAATTLQTIANGIAVSFALAADAVTLLDIYIKKVAAKGSQVKVFGKNIFSDATVAAGQAVDAQADALIARGSAVTKVFKQIQDAQKNLPKPSAAPAADGPGSTIRGPKFKNSNDEDATNAAVKLAKARADFAKAESDASLKLLQASNRNLLAAEKADYDAGIVSLERYFSERERVLTEESADQKKILLAAAAAASALPAGTDLEQVTRSRAIKEADAQLAIEQVNLEGQLAALQRERGAALIARADKELSKKQEALDLAAKLLELNGKQEAAAVAALDAELNKLDQLLAKQGVVADERQRLIDAQRTKGVAKINFDTASAAGDAEFLAIDAERERLALQAKRGQIFEFQANDRAAAFERQRLENLRKISAELNRLAEQSGDVTQLDKARSFASSISEATASVDEYGTALAKVKTGAFDSFTAGFDGFLTGILNGTSSVKDAFRSMAASVLDNIRKIAQEIIVQQAVKALFSSFGFADGGLVKPPAKFATGGYVSGPGTGTSDSIPAMLSNGEFVIPAKVVSRPGMLEELEHLRRTGTMRPSFNKVDMSGRARFADGGLVGSLREAGSAGGGSTELTVGLSDGLLIKQLKTPEGKRVLVEALGEQRRAIRQLIG